MKSTERIYFHQEANRKVITALFCLITAVITIFSILLGAIHTQAAPSKERRKYYKSIQIERGDTLWGIAEEYMTSEYSSRSEYMNEIRSINHISEDAIHAGQYLVVPYYSVESTNDTLYSR